MHATNSYKGRGLSSCDVAGVAIGFAALVDSRVNRILSTNGKYDDVKEIDLAEWIHENVGLPARIENDARTALLGESDAGAARRRSWKQCRAYGSSSAFVTKHRSP